MTLEDIEDSKQYAPGLAGMVVTVNGLNAYTLTGVYFSEAGGVPHYDGTIQWGGTVLHVLLYCDASGWHVLPQIPRR